MMFICLCVGLILAKKKKLNAKIQFSKSTPETPSKHILFIKFCPLPEQVYSIEQRCFLATGERISNFSHTWAQLNAKYDFNIRFRNILMV